VRRTAAHPWKQKCLERPDRQNYRSVNWTFFVRSGQVEFHRVLKAHECQKRPNLHTSELNTTFFCSTSLLKAPNRLKSLKLAWRFVLTSCDIYQNPFSRSHRRKFSNSDSVGQKKKWSILDTKSMEITTPYPCIFDLGKICPNLFTSLATIVSYINSTIK
jgi:hypothetical protein